MRALVIGALALAVAAMTGCAGQVTVTPGAVAQYGDEELCYLHGNTKHPVALQEIREREMFGEPEMRLISNSRIARGMSEKALFCSWGRPAMTNTSAGAWGSSKQHVYRRCPSCKTSYVYVRRGKVDAWQN